MVTRCVGGVRDKVGEVLEVLAPYAHRLALASRDVEPFLLRGDTALVRRNAKESYAPGVQSIAQKAPRRNGGAQVRVLVVARGEDLTKPSVQVMKCLQSTGAIDGKRPTAA